MRGRGARVYAALQRFRVSTLKPTRSRMSAYVATVAHRARFQTGRPPARHGRARWCRLCKSAERQASGRRSQAVLKMLTHGLGRCSAIAAQQGLHDGLVLGQRILDAALLEQRLVAGEVSYPSRNGPPVGGPPGVWEVLATPVVNVRLV